MTRPAQRSLTLQPGNLLASLRLTLSVGFNMSMALHAATVLDGSRLLPPRDFSHLDESHPMDHDSDSSGHATYASLTRLPYRWPDSWKLSLVPQISVGL